MRTHLRQAAVPAIVLVVLVGCTEPELPRDEGTPETPTAESPAPEPAEDDQDAALRQQIERLGDVVAAAQDGLATAMDATTLAAASAGAERALDALLAADDGGAGGAGEEAGGAVTGLLPARTTTRGDTTVPTDQLTVTLATAQDRGGTLGQATADLLRDPIAGDLGAWQRDAGGMAEMARVAATSSTNLSVLERTILELDGEGTRALAWTITAVEAADPELARAAAERASTHLDIIEVAIDELPVEGTDS